jgi:hypothetical protein
VSQRLGGVPVVRLGRRRLQWPVGLGSICGLAWTHAPGGRSAHYEAGSPIRTAGGLVILLAAHGRRQGSFFGSSTRGAHRGFLHARATGYPRRMGKPPDAILELSIPERILLFCVASGTEWERAGITGATVTATIVRGLIARDAAAHLTLTPEGRKALEALLAKDG